jgi:hypothetical protein
MATTYKVYVDGVYTTYTAAEYEAKFGYKPTEPRAGERLFGGRYEHRTFISGSAENEEYGTFFNTGNSTTSSIAD